MARTPSTWGPCLQVTACSDEIACSPGWSRIEEAWRASYLATSPIPRLLANVEIVLRGSACGKSPFKPDSTLPAECRKLAPDFGTQ